ncbi:uncharacterized protein SPSK_02096 [Sporothrix schenckii 1099-18]|uniref:Uncharacterized protein n=1 Tax=Sporothrix schenckii 1099-18 TaxID=1397361 RepID=A0A0F2MBA4_SPOSC|nr:uncharacterized protein SPSK_02096 [Sporothrix schenckii 1099-18]KJR86963.1 hypothetical protein SPSK_02096 [Sporothrix schenckii 1099-18]
MRLRKVEEGPEGIATVSFQEGGTGVHRCRMCEMRKVRRGSVTAKGQARRYTLARKERSRAKYVTIGREGTDENEQSSPEVKTT